MSDRTVLTPAEIHALAKVAAVVHDNGLLDPDHTAGLVLDVCRKCSEAVARGEMLAIASTQMSLIETLTNSREKDQ